VVRSLLALSRTRIKRPKGLIVRFPLQVDSYLAVLALEAPVPRAYIGGKRKKARPFQLVLRARAVVRLYRELT
jgi:hypothetical protein